MTPFNFVLANQSLLFQANSPNKKARLIASGQSDQNNFPEAFALILSVIEESERREYNMVLYDLRVWIILRPERWAYNLVRLLVLAKRVNNEKYKY
jgi:hypothetical protein